MNYLSLFSGIGGLDLGLDRAGMTCVGQVERDPFCQRVLAKHWPEVPRHDDVRTAPGWWLGAARPAVRLVAGGFPCQGHSVAGKQLGTADERWGWPWFRAVVEAVAPAWILIENVPNLVRTGLRDVLIDLAEDGFDAWWGRVPAAAVGAPHLRWRLFVIAAHTERVQLRHEPGWSRGASRTGPTVTGHDGTTWALADATGERRGQGRPGGPAGDGADRHGFPAEELADADSEQAVWAPIARAERDPWPAEPDVGRVAHGIPDRVDRGRALGNAVVPAVGEYVGRLITGAAGVAR